MAVAVMKPTPGIVSKPAALLALSRPSQEFGLKPSDPRLQIEQLIDQRRQSPPGRRRQHGIGTLVCEDCDQLADAADPLGDDDAELGQVPAKGIDQHRALADQQSPHATEHEHTLRLARFDRHEAHARTGDRFADRFRIGCIGLAASDIGFDVSRRHQLDRMAPLDQLAGPVVGGRARFHADQARAQTSKER
jgi:hypothetical protein